MHVKCNKNINDLRSNTISRPPTRDTGPRTNRDITVPKVRLIDADGEMIGVVTIDQAMERAENAGLDLLEVSPQADPPVCKIIDYGKFRYEQQKKANIARKKQKIVEVKELKVRPTIEKHDYDVKMRNAHKFLDNGDKVKFTMRFRGREMAHQNLGMDVLKKIRDELGEKIKVEQRPRMEGHQMVMVVSPAASLTV